MSNSAARSLNFPLDEPTPSLKSLRARGPSNRSPGPRVHYADLSPPPRLTALQKQRLRIRQFQKQWEQIKEDLPPQLTRRHIGMISIGGVIGTGLFVGSADALYHGGPLGALLGYSVIGTIVYCLCVSIGEMIAFLPNVGGVVGLADLYVDRALGFSLGWAAWYNWSITIPAEITAAAGLTRQWKWSSKIPVSVVSTIFLGISTIVNCFSSGVYGEFEFWFSTFKVFTITLIVVACFAIDLGAGDKGRLGFQSWKQDPFAQYLDIPGYLGRFLGFGAVLMQASFSFFGSEVPGIAAGEVIDATRNVPRALKRVWIRITLFYLLGIFSAGLIVNRSDLAQSESDSSAKVSPFVLAFRNAGSNWKWLGHALNGAILLSAWSAAASDIYIASRFLFFLSRRYHAPKIFASLIRHPSDPNEPTSPPAEEEDILDQDDEDLPPNVSSDAESFDFIEGSSSGPRYQYEQAQRAEIREMLPTLQNEEYELVPLGSPSASNKSTPDLAATDLESATLNRREAWLVLPFYAVIASASVGGLSFLDSSGPGTAAAFNWLVSVASIASLQSWSGMLFTYIRWHKGTVYAEKKARAAAPDDDEAIQVLKDIANIKQHRHPGQPYLAIYAFSVCVLILVTNGWAVFVRNPWSIAVIPGQPLQNYQSNQKVATPVSQFLSSYIPIPCFLLLTFGYKLIHQTKMVPVEEMSFSRENVPPRAEDPVSDKLLDRVLGWLLVI